eukprot:1051072-Pyramimonas_sp.AAC.2
MPAHYHHLGGRTVAIPAAVAMSDLTPASLRARPKVKNTRGIFKVCCTVHEGCNRPKRGVANVVNTLV